jgi:hypothetical protein
MFVNRPVPQDEVLTQISTPLTIKIIMRFEN